MKSGSATLESPGMRALWSVRTVKASPGVAPGAGRGLFAVELIVRGEIIDRACTTEIDAEQCLVLDKMHPVGDFYFEHPRGKELGLMVFGLASLCNHRDEANADVRFVWDEGLGWIAELFALADIRAGAEITYRYKMIWFDRRD